MRRERTFGPFTAFFNRARCGEFSPLRTGRPLMLFFVCCIATLLIGRKMGWMLSRRVFYAAPSAIAVSLCLLWGVAIALGFRLMVRSLHPNVFLAVLGFMAGGYIAVPDYGIGEVWAFPQGTATRKDIISNFPFLLYI